MRWTAGSRATRGDIDANPAAWAAGSSSRCRSDRLNQKVSRIESLLGVQQSRRSLPLHLPCSVTRPHASSRRSSPFTSKAGFRDFKIKLSGEREARSRKDPGPSRLPASLPKRCAPIANNLCARFQRRHPRAWSARFPFFRAGRAAAKPETMRAMHRISPSQSALKMNSG